MKPKIIGSMREKAFLKLSVAVTVLLLLFSRAITLTHNMNLHVDEGVIYEASDSLIHFLAGKEDVYTELKEYPEGAIVLQLPIHICAAIFQRFSGIEVSPQLRGRIASVTFFVLGAILGTIIEYRYFGKSKAAVIVYSAILVFSIMHIEQSRYSTGDPISFFLLMAILFFTARGETEKKIVYWISAGFLSGLLCAVKYPLLFWSLIPITAAWRNGVKQSRSRAKLLMLVAVSLIVGFLFGSPKVISDPHYIIRVVQREMSAYSGGDPSGVGGPFDHLCSLTIYSFLYAGFPFAPAFAIAAIIERNQAEREDSEHAFLFNKLLPCLIAGFFIYNLFVKTLAMRTYYPFFFLTDLYAAAFLGNKHKGIKRGILCFLTILFLARGIYFIGVLTERDGVKNLRDMVSRTIDESWKHTTFLEPGRIIYYPVGLSLARSIEPQIINLVNDDYQNDSEYQLNQGELLITGSIDHFLVIIGDPFEKSQYISLLSERWNTFKRINCDYYVGSVYPARYYYLFGFWVKGTSGTFFEFPTNYVYYRSAE